VIENSRRQETAALQMWANGPARGARHLRAALRLAT